MHTCNCQTCSNARTHTLRYSVSRQRAEREAFDDTQGDGTVHGLELLLVNLSASKACHLVWKEGNCRFGDHFGSLQVEKFRHLQDVCATDT